MEKLIKKVLTVKAIRNNTALIAFVAVTMNAGLPWFAE